MINLKMTYVEAVKLWCRATDAVRDNGDDWFEYLHDIGSDAWEQQCLIEELVGTRTCEPWYYEGGGN